MMNPTQGGTVTTKNTLSTSFVETLSTDGCDIRSSARAESNPVARKRRMTEQPSSQIPKAPRRGLTELEDDEFKPEDNIIDAQFDFHHPDETRLSKKPPIHPDVPRKRQLEGQTLIRKDDSERLRKTIQWLEDGARKLREDLADARSELYEERKASRLAKREIEVAVREAKTLEASKYQKIINELKLRIAQPTSRTSDFVQLNNARVELLKEENHRREITVARKRLAEADETIRKLRSSSLDPGCSDTKKRRRLDTPDVRKMENEIRCLREANKRLEDKLQIVTDAERARAIELRVQHENYEAEMCALKKAQRTETIRMMEAIRSKERDIEKLEKLTKRKWRAREDELMRKLRESERGHQIRLGPRIEDKITRDDNTDLCKGDCDVGEVERLRELAVEQQEVIEFLRQALKERERKLDQLSNKKRKEEFYKQWLELEPVAEVDDEDEHDEDDSALSSAPTSLSPQPGNHWQSNGVTRETYEALLLEFEELQTKCIEEHQELLHARSQVRDLEKALLQETRGSQNSRRALSDKLREAEDRESSLLAEISELREQNELLEFRVLELEETGGPRESPDTADSGIVSPEPIALFKDQNNRQQRAIATVIPYNSYNQSMSPVTVQKSPLSLQESGIFEEDDDHHVELTTCGTQTETPSGELLQEVQRLQELRERIQERAVKVPVNVESLETEDNRLTSHKERIRELEERLGVYEIAEIKRSRDQLVAKQREEDLLDENYRLTERVYWLENELHNFKERGKNGNDIGTVTDIDFRDCGTSTDVTITEYFDDKSTVFKDTSDLSPCEKIFYDALSNIDDSEICLKARNETNGFRVSTELLTGQNVSSECADCAILRMDYDAKIQQLARAECSFWRRSVDLERKEVAFAKTLKQVDATWKQLEVNHACKLEGIQTELGEKVGFNQKMLDRICELEEMIRNHVCQAHFDEVDMSEQKGGMEKMVQTDESMEIDEGPEKIRVNRFTQTETDCSRHLRTQDDIHDTSGKIVAELASEAREDDENTIKLSCTVSRICVQPDETTANDHVEITESDMDKKVRKTQNCRSEERDGWAMKVWNTPRGTRSVKNVRAIVNGHRFILYQEICV